MSSVTVSAYTSLGLQFITGIIEGTGLTLKLDPKDLILQDILLMELFVQTIEFIFYMYLVQSIVSGKLAKIITSHRYFDWSITTPVMLISFILFFKYLKDKDRGIRFQESFLEEKWNIIKIVLANALMLLFGFLGERGIINQYFGVAMGFIPFSYIFKQLYSNYAKDTTTGKTLFYFSFLVWGLYGVAATLPFAEKNTMYNILDLFSKNAYGLFLYYYIYVLSKSNTKTE
jgi:bacteriorhodopsin